MNTLFLATVCVMLLLVSPLKANEIEDRDDEYSEMTVPVLSLNTFLNRTELSKLSAGTYIQQFVSFLLTGSYDPKKIPVNNATDELTVNDLLELGIQGLGSILADEIKYDPEFYEKEFADLDDIIRRLRDEGTDNVTLGELKKYITLQTVQAAAALYFGLNAQNYNQRFHSYLENELFGGIKDDYCRLYAIRWFDDLARGNETWPLFMFDAMGKLPPGISKANINWMGSYTVCKDVNNPRLDPPIKGKYCRAFIGFPLDQVAADLPVDDSIGLTYGMCVPDRCQNEDVFSIVSNSLKLMSVFKYSWVNKVECDHPYELSDATIAFIVILSIIIAFVLISTLYDVIVSLADHFGSSNVEPSEAIAEKNKIAGENVLTLNKKVVKRRSKLAQLLVDSSLYANSLKFFRTDNGGKITCLNGIRFFSMVWIIFGHTFNYLGDRYKFLLVDNIITMQELNNEWYAQIIINGMLAVDTFFLMSAFLVTITLMNKLEKSRYLTHFEWGYYYIHRYWRLLPPYVIIIIIYAYILPAIGNGPLFEPDDYPPYAEDCKNYWWVYLLMLNNFVPNGKGVKCMGYLWYIPNDYQFYALTPIFVVLLYRYPAAGKFLIGMTLTATMSILAFLTANVYVSRKRDMVFVLLDMWEDVYIKPYCRGTPWLVGIVLGYIFFKFKKVEINSFLVAIGWMMSTSLALIAVFGSYPNHGINTRKMETAEFAIFFSFSKLVWALSIGWIIFACHYGYGGVVNSFLSVKTWIPLTRLSYCAYLIHPVIMTFVNYHQGTLFHATGYTLVYAAVGHVFVSLIISYFYTLFFEMPFIALEKLIYNPKH